MLSCFASEINLLEILCLKSLNNYSKTISPNSHILDQIMCTLFNESVLKCIKVEKCCLTDDSSSRHSAQHYNP